MTKKNHSRRLRQLKHKRYLGSLYKDGSLKCAFCQSEILWGDSYHLYGGKACCESCYKAGSYSDL